MKNIISIIVTALSIAAFILVVQPQYNEIKKMQIQETELEDVLGNARRLQDLRDDLLEKRDKISRADITRLAKLIPESADNVRLILKFQQIADRYGLEIQAASASKNEGGSDGQEQQNFDIETKDYGIITLDFSLSGGYSEIISFLEDIEKNLRITDVRTFSISPPAGGEGEYSYDLSIDTYWLKDNI